MKDVKKRHLEETAAKKLEEKRLKEEIEQIKAEYDKLKKKKEYRKKYMMLGNLIGNKT